MNQLSKWIFLFCLSIVILYLAWLIGRDKGILIVFFLIVCINAIAIFYAKKSTLKRLQAEPMTNASHEINKKLSMLAEKAGIPMPALYLMANNTLNAMVVGNNERNCAIVLTTGLIQYPDPGFIEVALAYSVAQIKSGYFQVGSAAGVIADAFMNCLSLNTWRSVFELPQKVEDEKSKYAYLFVAPFASLLIRLSMFKRRVLKIDEMAIALLDDKSKFVDTIQKMNEYNQNKPFPALDLSPGFAHLFMLLPIKNQHLMRWFDTFPALSKRTV